MKRLFTFFLAFAVAFSFFTFPFSARAVVNPAFIYSAMYSYLLSTGMQFNASSASESDVVDMMGDLYDDYLADTSSGLAVADYESGVSLTSLGQFAFNYAVVQPLQDFASWITSHFSLSSGATEFTPVIVPSSSNSYSDPSYPNSNYYDTENWSTVYASSRSATITWEDASYDYSLEFTYSSGYGTYIIRNDLPSTNGFIFYFVSPDISSAPLVSGLLTAFRKVDGSVATTNTLDLTTLSLRTSKFGSRFYGGFISVSKFNYTNFQSSCLTPFSGTILGTENLSDIFTIITSSPSLTSSLAVKLGTDIFNRANDVANGESLIVDMGLSAGATITDAISGVSAGIADGSIATSVPVTSVVADAVIDTPVQPYPDVDSLGLPELGLALTTRFPFSIPWDISAIYSALSAPSEPPVKTFDLIPASVMARWGINANTSITIDLTEQKYAVLLAIIHWSCIIGFCLGLAVMTKRYVWTTGG